jgi:hypothetical protein
VDGADFIKVYSRLPRADFHAVASEARRLGRMADRPTGCVK